MGIGALTASALTNSRQTSDRQRCVSEILTMCEINVPGSDGHLSRGAKTNSRGLSNRARPPTGIVSSRFLRRGNSGIKGAGAA